MQADTITYTNNRHTCALTKPSRQLPVGLFQPLSNPRWPWSHIELITDFPISQGNRVDRFSKLCRLIPLPKLPTALETVEHLLYSVFRFYSLPEHMVSGHGTQITSRVWKAF